MIGLYNDPDGARLLIAELCDQRELWPDHVGTLSRTATPDQWQRSVNAYDDIAQPYSWVHQRGRR